MAELKDFEVKVQLIPEGKIIAYELEYYLTPKEFNLLPKKLQTKFRPKYSHYKSKIYKMNCPYCGGKVLYFDTIMRNYICEDCDKLFEREDLDE